MVAHMCPELVCCVWRCARDCSNMHSSYHAQTFILVVACLLQQDGGRLHRCLLQALKSQGE